MTEPTKTRPGDQPLPTAGHECVQDKLIALIEERKQLGIQRYGSPLMTHNGRDAGRDAVEEALDLTVYSMQVALELRDLRAAIERARVLGRRLAAHAVGFQDVLDDGDRGAWGRIVNADIAELCAALTVSAQPESQAGRCRCPHAADEHSMYGCVDGCGCEWMPKRKPMDPVHILGVQALTTDEEFARERMNPGPDFTSPIAGNVELRKPCPYCGDRQMIPTHQFQEHVSRLHPDVRTGGPGLPVPPVEEAPLAACRIMVTRTCPKPYNGPCGDRPCARFESEDPGPWLDTAEAPATCNEPGPWEDAHACVLSAGHPDDHQAHDGCGWRTGHCGSGQHKTHTGFTCAEVEQTRPYWERRWADHSQQQHPEVEATPDPSGENTLRRDSLRNLLDRMQGMGLTGTERAILRQHVEAEIRERDNLATTVDRMKRTNRMVNGGARASRERAEEAERDRDQHAAVLAEVLATFVHKVPGYRIPRVRSGEVDVVTLDKWRSVVAPTVERPWWEQVALYENEAVEATRHVLELKAAIERVRALHDCLAKATDLAYPADLITREAAAKRIAAALDGPTETEVAEEPTTCTATITDSLGSEALIRCVEPAGHYDEDQRPEFLEGKQEPRGWHTDREGRVWSDRATTATPHGEQPATEA